MKLNITLPSNLSEISVKKYQQFLDMKENSNDEEFIAQKMIQIFCDLKLDQVGKIQMKYLNELIQHFTSVFEEKSKLETRFEMGGIKYGLIPKFDDISFGEYVDIEHHLNKWGTYHKALAVLYRPITTEFKGKYQIEDYDPTEEKQELMREAPLSLAIGSSFFFANLGTELLIHIQTYLKNELKMINKDSHSFLKELNSGKTGDGTQAFTEWQAEISLSLMKSQNIDLLNVSLISPSVSKNLRLKPENLDPRVEQIIKL